jgi:hypothetical protein
MGKKVSSKCRNVFEGVCSIENKINSMEAKKSLHLIYEVRNNERGS